MVDQTRSREFFLDVFETLMTKTADNFYKISLFADCTHARAHLYLSLDVGIVLTALLTALIHLQWLIFAIIILRLRLLLAVWRTCGILLVGLARLDQGTFARCAAAAHELGQLQQPAAHRP